MTLRDLTTMTAAEAASLRIVFCDIDDTLTLEGRLPAVAYAALERLAEAGIDIVPVTGRPAGWCDMIARFWPVRAIVGENGAFYFAYRREERRVKRVYWRTAEERAADRVKLERIRAEVLATIEGTGIASDQAYREADLAVDFCEDVEPLPHERVLAIKALFEYHGAVAKISSIHVNGWFGDYDKRRMCERYLLDEHGLALDEARNVCAFVGDSPNDEPMFETFPCSIGVRNLEDFLDDLRSRPTYLCRGRGGIGFAEFVDIILSRR
ncbi:MAG: HAD-IIB family hydrolase [Geminicoccaceae bacterium]